jgi:hypothetical protein
MIVMQIEINESKEGLSCHAVAKAVSETTLEKEVVEAIIATIENPNIDELNTWCKTLWPTS